MTETIYESPIGLGVFNFDFDSDNFTITGRLSDKYRFRDFDGAYDFEEYIQKHIECEGIDFDSEYSQFFAYAKTKERAMKFVKDVEEWFDKVLKLVS